MITGCPSELVMGFEAVIYSTSEGTAVVEIVVVILIGSVGQGETVILDFYTSDCAASDFSSPGSGGYSSTDFSIIDDCATSEFTCIYISVKD